MIERDGKVFKTVTKISPFLARKSAEKKLIFARKERKFWPENKLVRVLKQLFNKC